MQAHLTDEQSTDELIGSEDLGTREHLAACPACGDEQERLRRALAHYCDTLHSAAERPASLWLRQREAIAARRPARPAPRLAWAAAAAAMVLLAVLLIEKTPRAAPVAQNDPDHVLLVEVERSVKRELPRALEPAALLAQEVHRGTERRANP